jgi:hypothetical protein
MGAVRPIQDRIIEAENRWPQLRGLFKRKTRSEAAGPCPFCRMSDHDGFLLFSHARYWCRNCGTSGWVDEDDTRRPSPEELQELRMQALERQMREHEQRLAKLEEMHNCKDHLRYHENLTDRTRQLWYESNIFDDAIDKFMLGYSRECPTYRESPSLTVPVYGHDNQLADIRHRLLQPNGSGKYRPHRGGLGTHLFNAPILRSSHERLLIVEGEKKVICLDQAGFPAVGIMGKSAWNKRWFDWFDVGRVYIALDPDADESAERLGKIFVQHGFNNVYLADFPAKPDDFVYQYGGGVDQVERVLQLARPVQRG